VCLPHFPFFISRRSRVSKEAELHHTFVKSRASLERELEGKVVFTQQDLVEQALEPWLSSGTYPDAGHQVHFDSKKKQRIAQRRVGK
jgi:hypothetical protein